MSEERKEQDTDPERVSLPRVFELDKWRLLFSRPTADQKATGRLIIFRFLPPESEEKLISLEEEEIDITDHRYNIQVEGGYIFRRPRLPRELEVIAAYYLLSLKGEFQEVGQISRDFMDEMTSFIGVHITEDGKKITAFSVGGDDERFNELAKRFDNINKSFASWIIFQTYRCWQLGIEKFTPERQQYLEQTLAAITYL